MRKEKISGLELELTEELRDSPYLVVEFLDGQGAGLSRADRICMKCGRSRRV